MTTALVPVSDIERMAVAMAASKLFGMKTKEEAMSLMFLAQAEGLHPAIAARDYHIIQGRPALKADAMMARFQQAGGRVEWKQYDDACASARFTHPQGGSVEVEWTMERAREAGLAGKDTWKKFPRNMLRARVISEGIRTVFPGVAVGVYTPEEVQDFESAKSVKTRDVRPEPDYALLVGVEKLEDYLADIANVPSLDGLKHKFSAAQKAFKGNEEALTKIVIAKDKRKADIEAMIVSAGLVSAGQSKLKQETEQLLQGEVFP